MPSRRRRRVELRLRKRSAVLLEQWVLEVPVFTLALEDRKRRDAILRDIRAGIDYVERTATVPEEIEE